MKRKEHKYTAGMKGSRGVLYTHVRLEMVTFRLRVVLTTNKNNPNIMMDPPSIVDDVIVSCKMK